MGQRVECPAVSFLAGERLVLLFAVAALAAGYVVVQRQRRQYAVRFTNVELLAAVAPRHPSWRRHLAAACLLVALTLFVVAFARPTHAAAVPTNAATVMLDLDVSPSMRATDVKPSRVQAAVQAATQFTRTLPSRYRLGLVTFAGTATVQVLPTNDRTAVLSALKQRIGLREQTAIGEAIFASLDAINHVPTDHGHRIPARILLLSDGATNAGRSNDQAAAAAVRQHVPVSTIAFGTQDGYVTVDNQQVPVPPDPDALHKIADTTGGHFNAAPTAEALNGIYRTLQDAIIHTTKQREVTVWFVGIALAFALAAAAASLVWTARLP
jgi:Ca-activated chloride channel family protein